MSVGQARRVAVGWAIVATAVPMFMVALDNLVVTNALVQISRTFHAPQDQLQWVVNAYVLAFAGLQLAGAALGDRYGRRRIFLGGVVLFTLASAACGMADSVGMLIAARIAQGAGAAAILPLSLTLITASVPERMRTMAIGLWGGVNGLGIAVGPLVGGLVMEGINWHWIFWINIPVGVLALALTRWAVPESIGRQERVDVAGTVTVTGAVVLAVWAIVRSGDDGWGSTTVVASLIGSAVLFVAFVLWERRAPAPLVPLRFYRLPAFMLSNAVSLTMYFGVFGSIYFLAQYMQGPMGFTPFEAGLRTLPWTAAPMLVVPLASMLVDRVGPGALMAAGSLLQAGGLAWLAFIAAPGQGYGEMVPAMAAAGVGMGLVFAANPAAVIASVAEHEHGAASGVNNTIREFGGAFGIAVLTTVFASQAAGGATTQSFIAGMRPAIWLGVAVVLVGAAVALFVRLPRRQPVASEPASELAVLLAEDNN